MKDKGKLFLLWFFGVLFALTPLGFDLLHRQTEPTPPPLVTLIIHGEVLIIAVAILADTFVRSVASDDTKTLRLGLILGSVFVLLLLGYDAGQVRQTVEGTERAVDSPFVLHLVWLHSTIALIISMVLSLTASLALED